MNKDIRSIKDLRRGKGLVTYENMSALIKDLERDRKEMAKEISDLSFALSEAKTQLEARARAVSTPKERYSSTSSKIEDILINYISLYYTLSPGDIWKSGKGIKDQKNNKCRYMLFFILHKYFRYSYKEIGAIAPMDGRMKKEIYVDVSIKSRRYSDIGDYGVSSARKYMEKDETFRLEMEEHVKWLKENLYI